MLKRHLSVTAASTAVVLLSNLIRQLIIYRNLSVEVIGEYVFVATIIVFLQPLLSGNIKIFLTSKAPELPDQEGFGLLKAVFFWEAATATTGFLIYFGLVHAGLSLVRLSPILVDPSILYWAFAISVSSSLFSQFQRFLSNTLRISTANSMEIVSGILYTGGLAYLVLINGMRTVHAIFLSWALSTLISFLVLMVLYRRPIVTSRPAGFTDIKRGVHFSVPSLSTEFGGAIVGYFDRLTVGHYMAAASLGLYGFIYNIINIAQVAARSVMDSLFGSYFLFALKSKREEMANVILDIYLRCAILAGVSVLTFFVMSGRQFILLLSRPEMLPSYPLFFILWPLFIVNAFIPVLSLHLHYVQEERRRIVLANTVIIPVSIVLYIFAIKYFHLVGACVSSTATAALTFGAMAWQSPEWRAKPVRALLHWKALLTGALTVGTGFLVRPALMRFSSGVVAVVAGITLSILSVVLIAFLTGYVSTADRKKLSAINQMKRETVNA